jgi:sugar lactone lactonase YvrE
MLFVLAVLGRGMAWCDTLLVSTGDNTIREFSLAGQDLGIFASAGLNNPYGLALDRSGNLFVANLGSNTIHEFSPTGQDLGIFASVGLNEPIGLAFDSEGNLFVSNLGDNTIHKFSQTGEDLGVFASLLGIGCPVGLAVNRLGTVLVADLCSSVIRKFSATGHDLGIFAAAGLSNPFGLAFDASGNLFVSNTDNGGTFRNTIHKFSPTGKDLGTFASTGLGFPTGLVFDRSGNLLVSNEEGNSIRQFSSTGQDLGDFAVLSGGPLFLVIAPPLTTLTSSLSPSIYGQKVTWTAVVTTSGTVVPTGKVTFTWSGYTIGSATLNSSGVATLTRSNLNADAYPLTAVYSGDADNLASTSAVLNQVVLETTSAAAITSSPNPSTQGQAVTFTAKITSPTVIPKGPVTFTAGKTVLGTAQLSGGKATLTISSLAVGSTKVTATYYGDSNIAKSSASVTQTVR